MAPKQVFSSQASSSYHSEVFSTQEQEINFNWYYTDKLIYVSRYFDEELFK